MAKLRLSFLVLVFASFTTACSLNRAKRDKSPEADLRPATESAETSDSAPTVTLLPAEKAKEEPAAAGVAPTQDLSKVTMTTSDSANAKLPAAAAAETPEAAAEAGAANGGKQFNSPSDSTLTLVPVAETGTKKSAAKNETPSPKHFKTKGTPAKTALLWLQHGNTRYVKGQVRKDGESKKDIVRLSGAQHPHSIVLACSDSRVPPELVFDQRLGEVFVVRTLGEALDDNAVASIEYGLEQLGIKNIVVLGHNSCGAINAAIQTPEGGSAGSPAMDHLVNDIRPRIKAAMASSAPQPDGANESLANAKGIAEDLKKRSAIIRAATENGDVVITAGLYHLDSGKVTY